jgi:mevalonate kinase
MQGQNLENWQKLCEEAATEQDPERLLQLIHQIDRMLTEKEQRLKAQKEAQQIGELANERIKLLDEESNRRLEQITPESKMQTKKGAA